MRTQARFRTTLFTPLGNDDDQRENGRELAQWLCANLPADLRPDAMAEGWGHRIDFGDPRLGNTIFVGCGHVEGDEWSCYCEPEPNRVERTAPVAEMVRVIGAIDALLAKTTAISDVQWFQNDAREREFNHAPRAFARA
ncbi:MAG: hypothetical protein ACREO3_07000 [Arenimonas sp.]